MNSIIFSLYYIKDVYLILNIDCDRYCSNSVGVIITIMYNNINANIETLLHPQSVNTILNTTISLTCKADVSLFVFEVNNELASLKIIESKGFQQQSTETLSDNKWRRTLLAEALKDNNNTNIIM